jgi:hypothetical protein
MTLISSIIVMLAASHQYAPRCLLSAAVMQTEEPDYWPEVEQTPEGLREKDC